MSDAVCAICGCVLTPASDPRAVKAHVQRRLCAGCTTVSEAPGITSFAEGTIDRTRVSVDLYEAMRPPPSDVSAPAAAAGPPPRGLSRWRRWLAAARSALSR